MCVEKLKKVSGKLKRKGAMMSTGNSYNQKSEEIDGLVEVLDSLLWVLKNFPKHNAYYMVQPLPIY